MSEKVVLTQEQVNAIELWLSNYKDKDQLLMIQYFVKVKEADASNEGWIGDYKPMKELSISQLARAIHVGYEVEKPRFQAGDKVIHLDATISDMVFEIKNIMPIKSVAYEFTNGGWDYADRLRHATEEEIYWLHELKRKKVPDFKIGDVFVDRLNAGYRLNEEQSVKDFIQYYEEDDFRGIYPAESFKPFRKGIE